MFVVANFDDQTQILELEKFNRYGINPRANYIDLYSGAKPSQYDGCIALHGRQIYWLSEH